MTYGTIQERTRELLLTKLSSGGMGEVTFDPIESAEGNDSVYRLDVIFGGALDESFYVQSDADTVRCIAKWVAEDCKAEAEADPDSPLWDVGVYYPGFAEEPDLVYTLKSVPNS